MITLKTIIVLTIQILSLQLIHDNAIGNIYITIMLIPIDDTYTIHVYTIEDDVDYYNNVYYVHDINDMIFIIKQIIKSIINHYNKGYNVYMVIIYE